MTSSALRSKIAKRRAFAPNELPKARLCANVILSTIEGEEAMIAALSDLKKGVGVNWGTVNAMQFMSGRRGEFATDCATPEERPRLYLAHLIAKQICSDEGLGGVNPPDGMDAAKLQSLVAAARSAIQ